MPINIQPVTLVTVVHPICSVFIERFPKMLKWFTDKNLVAKHVIVVNPANEWKTSGDAPEWRAFVQRVEAAFEILPWNVQYIYSDYNRWDLPGFNDAFDSVETSYWIGISPDTRILHQNWIEEYFAVLNEPHPKNVGLIGPNGPSENLTPASVNQKDWGWIPKLLVDRGLLFDHCHHVQTWCFFVDSEAFVSAGKFWERADHRVEGKGDVITAEIYLSVCMRRAGYEIGYERGPALYHYGTNNGKVDLAEVDAFDRHNNFTPFE